jgi:hypothetical protein
MEDFVRSLYIEKYRLRLREGGADRYLVDHSEDTVFRARALSHSYAILRARPDWLEVSRGVTRAWADWTQIIQRDDFLFYHDRLSGAEVVIHRSPRPRGDRAPTEVIRAAADNWDSSGAIGDWDDVRRLIPICGADQLLARGDLDLLRQVVLDYGDRFFILAILDTPYSYLSDHLGFYGLMTIEHDRPSLLHRMLERQLDQTQEMMVVLAVVGVHGVYVEEIFTGSDMISPRAYDEFVLQYNRPFFCRPSELGLLSIHYVGGDAVSRLESMVGCDGTATAVPEGKRNLVIAIKEVVDRVAGRAAVFGTIDAVRFGPGATMEEMAAEVCLQARIGTRAKGFVVSTGSPFPQDTNLRLIDTLVATAHQLEC